MHKEEVRFQQGVLEQFRLPKGVGELTSDALLKKAGEQMKALGLGSIVEGGHPELREVSITRDYLEKKVKVPVYSVEDLDKYLDGFSDADKLHTSTSRESVKIGERAVIKSSHLNKGADEVIAECGKTMDQYTQGLPVVPQAAVIHDQKSNLFYVVEPRGIPFTERVKDAARGYNENGDMTPLDDCLRAVGRLVKRCKESETYWSGTFGKDEEALILFDSEKGSDAIITDDKSFYSRPMLGWVESVIRYASKTVTPQEEKQKALLERFKKIIEDESGVELKTRGR
ncbi:MAG: hypothetical protein V1921_02260 [Candidatus Altiarchaeota archaeon]